MLPESGCVSCGDDDSSTFNVHRLSSEWEELVVMPQTVEFGHPTGALSPEFR
ncbi:hypothetical protein PISMIDRAFT_684475 [Pisolithus microcarpus 441]|uniref:Uncharacterized protein n=1 Tax=Pisolithus microcarpus 441 TaxID=765257 RepID=A0A0C9Z6X7_9AGAM|nr:hypothetical protein PISMIDRAFT_684475 [Pisolithus microcarpus 441]